MTLEQSKILKNLRKEAELTQKELAKNLGIGQSTIVGYEKGLHEATAEILSRYADFFNVSMDYLQGRTDELGSVVMPAPTTPALSDDERKLLDYYSQMSHPMKIRVIAYCEGMLSTGQNAASKRNA